MKRYIKLCKQVLFLQLIFATALIGCSPNYPMEKRIYYHKEYFPFETSSGAIIPYYTFVVRITNSTDTVDKDYEYTDILKGGIEAKDSLFYVFVWDDSTKRLEKFYNGDHTVCYYYQSWDTDAIRGAGGHAGKYEILIVDNVPTRLYYKKNYDKYSPAAQDFDTEVYQYKGPQKGSTMHYVFEHVVPGGKRKEIVVKIPLTKRIWSSI